MNDRISRRESFRWAAGALASAGLILGINKRREKPTNKEREQNQEKLLKEQTEQGIFKLSSALVEASEQFKNTKELIDNNPNLSIPEFQKALHNLGAIITHLNDCLRYADALNQNIEKHKLRHNDIQPIGGAAENWTANTRERISQITNSISLLLQKVFEARQKLKDRTKPIA